MSLADTFLEDLNDDEEEEGEQEQDDHHHHHQVSSSSTSTTTVKQQVKHDDDQDEDDDDEGGHVKIEPSDSSMPIIDDLDDNDSKNKEVSPLSQSTLLNSTRLSQHLSTISKLSDSSSHSLESIQRDRDIEYEFIVESNSLAVDIDNEISGLHKYVRDIYSHKYSELEQLVTSPVEYASIAKVIQNETDSAKFEKQLLSIGIPQTLILTISVTLTTTIGKPLSESDLQSLIHACDAIIALDQHKKKIYEYIESRMQLIAPNLSAMIGTSIAARLISIAGGLKRLSEIPACNIQVLGIKRKNLGGLSTSGKDIHIGILGHCDIIQNTPAALRSKAIRLLGGKCALAVRMDALNQDETGRKGQEFRDLIVAKIEKWQEPPPTKVHKSLPAPLPPPRKKRGGRRYRKEKERLQQTDLARLKNRMQFGGQEVTDDYTGEGYGLLGIAETGQIRVKTVDTQKLSKRLSKETQKKLNRHKQHGNNLLSGTQSTIAFTPFEGIELVNPELRKQRIKEANDKYFSEASGFETVIKDRDRTKPKQEDQPDSKRVKFA